MTAYVVLAVLLAVLALAVVSVLWDWRRSGRLFCSPVPRPYQDRDSQEAAWRQRCGEKMSDADAVLTMLCDAFEFNPDDRYKFGPDDKVTDIYRACYPRWKGCWSGDSMEIESLMMDIEKQYGIDVEEWHSDVSLGELVELATEKQSTGRGGRPE
jgi:hypothetical protein